MPTDKIIQEASGKPFCQKVAFLAMKLAHKAAPEDAYAQKVLAGDVKIGVLAMHVVAASDTVSAALDEGGSASVQDADIEAALKEIWQVRDRKSPEETAQQEDWLKLKNRKPAIEE